MVKYECRGGRKKGRREEKDRVAEGIEGKGGEGKGREGRAGEGRAGLIGGEILAAGDKLSCASRARQT